MSRSFNIFFSKDVLDQDIMIIISCLYTGKAFFSLPLKSWTRRTVTNTSYRSFSRSDIKTKTILIWKSWLAQNTLLKFYHEIVRPPKVSEITFKTNDMGPSWILRFVREQWNFIMKYEKSKRVSLERLPFQELKTDNIESRQSKHS